MLMAYLLTKYMYGNLVIWIPEIMYNVSNVHHKSTYLLVYISILCLNYRQTVENDNFCFQMSKIKALCFETF